jgi:hypothetical protein
VAFVDDRPHPKTLDLRNALSALVAGEAVPVRETPAIGCVLADFLPRPPTFAADVAPIVFDACGSCHRQGPVDVELHAVQPHAHYRAREVHGTATLPDGTTRPLITIREWDFRWQHVYRYEQPLALPRGTRLSMSTATTTRPTTRAIPIGRRVASGGAGAR